MMIRQAVNTDFAAGTVTLPDFSIHFIADDRRRMVFLSFDVRSFHQAKADLAALNPGLSFIDDKEFARWFRRILEQYVRGDIRYLPVPTSALLVRRGTELQKKVWQRISRIAYGRTRTYGELAKGLGNPKLARAVGQACGANPLALIVPCHRVVGNGNLGGFAGGLGVKSRLLALEKAGSQQR
jgi:methylated-DNA-[protein]-cysteine S-methyltransferase